MKTAALVWMESGNAGVVGAEQPATALVALINENGTVTFRLAREGESAYDAQDALTHEQMAAIAKGVE